MLTKSKVQTYKRFNGDIDGWTRVSRKSQDEISDTEWTQIDQLIQKLTICKRGLGSKVFCDQAKEELNLLAPEEAVLNAIMELISE
jgi:hypothetical protein